MTNKYSEKFKKASIALLLSIINNINKKNYEKYYKFFQKELNITPQEFNDILELQEFVKEHDSIKIEDEIETIRKELGYKKHEIMKFLMMLNRCVIIDGCSLESYRRFEKVRDTFIKKMQNL